MSDYTEDWHGWEAREEAESRTRGEAMSTPDDAWQEWSADTFEYEGTVAHTAFMFAYRRGQEDAADAMDGDRTLWHVLEATIERATGPASGADAAQDEAVKWLRDLAAGVGTKDGDDDE